MATPRLVNNIRPGSLSPFPAYLTAAENILYFVADDGQSGKALWKSDGTSAGTLLVKDLRADKVNPFIVNPFGSIGGPIGTSVGNTLFFLASDGVSIGTLWTSDGTGVGTKLLKGGLFAIGDRQQFNLLNPRGNLTGLPVIGNTLFFSGKSEGTGQSGEYELWATNGTATGTRLVKNIGQSAIFTGSYPSCLSRVANKIYFLAKQTNSFELDSLWASDGLAGSTVRVAQLVRPWDLTPSGGTLFFTANDPKAGRELWKSDGTQGGTFLLKDINPQLNGAGPKNSSPQDFTDVSGTLFFTAEDGIHGRALWTSDGTKAGTKLVKALSASSLTAAGKTLFFMSGRDLWASNGTEAGTVLVKNNITPISPGAVAPVGKNLYFLAPNNKAIQIWKTDGTPAGTSCVSNFGPRTFGSEPRHLTLVGTTLFFTADDGTNGRELWALDDVLPASPPVLAIAPLSASKAEGNRGATAFTFVVTRTGVTRGANSALWAVSGVGETGATGADFIGGVFPAGSVSFGPGQTSRTLTIAVAGDTVPEANNSFQVTLSAPTGATLGSASAKGTIVNDDPLPSLNLTALNPSRPEGNEGQTFFRYRVTRSGNLSGASSVQWGVTGLGSQAANAADFSGGAFPAGRLTFAAGEASKTLTLAVAGDTLVEANESFKLSLSAPLDANLGVATANGTIANDDTALSITPLSAVKAEGRSGVTSFTFVIQRSGITTGASSVRWSVKGSGAAPTVVGPLPYRSFADSPLKGLALPRFDLETFEDGLLNTPGVTIANNQPGGSALGVLQPSFTTDSVDADDGAEDGYGRNGHSFANLNNDGYESFGLTVSFSPTDLGGWPTSAGLVWTDGSTTAPTLFEAFDADGQSLGSLGPVQIGDAFFDGTTGEDRFFGVSSGSGIAKLTIRNPGGLNNLEIDHVQFGLGGAGQAAANAVDFLGATSGTVTFAAGQTSRTLTVNVQADSLQEWDDTFSVSLSAPSGATLGTRTASGTIRNDDWIGDAKANTLVGSELADLLDGRANVDVLTGKAGADLFAFRFASSPLDPSDSPLGTPDWITDFAFGADKITLLSPTGTALPKPTTFSRAANNSAASSLAQLTAAVFADANGALPGNQPLAANGAVLVQATQAAIAGTYVLINNSVAGRSDLGDLLIKLSGFSGPLPPLGLAAPETVFA